MSATAIAIGTTVVGQIQNVGQIVEISQSHSHQKEQVHWTKRGYHLDSQSLRLDALDHAKEEIRSHYDTYVSRLDTLLLVLALIWPFALNTIQFSEAFVPGLKSAHECPECIENIYEWLVGVWVALLGLILLLPFWGILMLIRCKLKLDSWLEYSLAGLNRRRREIVKVSQPSGGIIQDDETEKIVFNLVNVVLEYQEYLAEIWTGECSHLVHSATSLLWMSAVGALLLTAVSVWIFLFNQGGVHAYYSSYFFVMIVIAVMGPVVYLIWEKGRPKIKPPRVDPQELARSSFPLTSPRVRKASAAYGGFSDLSPQLQRAQSSPPVLGDFPRALANRYRPAADLVSNYVSRSQTWCRKRKVPPLNLPLIPETSPTRSASSRF